MGMKLMFLIYFIAASFFISGCKENKPLGFDERLQILEEKIEKVGAALENSEGLAKDASRIDYEVAKLFAGYIEWELAHPEIMTQALVSDRSSARLRLNPEQKKQRFEEYIDRELRDATILMDRSIRRMKDRRMKKTEGLTPIDWNRMVFRDGNFRVDDRVVFPGGFTILTWDLVNRELYPQWTEKDEMDAQKYIGDMQKIGVSITDLSIHTQKYITEEGKLDQKMLQKEILDEIERCKSMGVRIDIMFQFGSSDIMEKLWPGISSHNSNGVGIDIDHPGVPELLEILMSDILPKLKKTGAVVSFEMANEPFFNMAGWTKYTMQSYRRWLAEKHGSIKELNRLWKTDYRSFEALPYPSEKPQKKCSPGEWYDRITFHNYRVTSFFTKVSAYLHRSFPGTPVHLKGQDNNSLGPKSLSVTDGIDREMMGNCVDLHGLDTRPLPVTEPRMAVQGAEQPVMNYNDSVYSFHWLGQSFLYDYLTSLEPRHKIIDMEYHAFSINPIRVADIGEGHAAATLWLAHLHGLIGNMVWYWNARYGPNPFPASYYEIWYNGSISTQPIVAAEYFQTMLMLNKFSEEITRLANPSTKPVRLFVSNPSYIQNQRHIAALHRAYEAVCFHGQPIGFVTENILKNNGIPEGTEMIVIPDAEYVSAGALSVLETAKKKGIKLVRLGEYAPAMDEYGFVHPEERTAFLKDIPQIPYGSAKELDKKFVPLIAGLESHQAYSVRDMQGNNAFGVMHRMVQFNGRTVMLLVNLNPDATHVGIVDAEGRNVAAFDLLNQEKLNGKSLSLPYKGVRLLELNK